ncbi:Fur family transcriptional regulator [Streptomyces sp. NPDC000963]
MARASPSRDSAQREAPVNVAPCPATTARTAVYNTLGELVALGEVVELSTDGRAKRYDPNARRAHQHLVCSGCGLIRDVHPTGDPLAVLPSEERFGFAVEKADVTYRGLCPDCSGE